MLKILLLSKNLPLTTISFLGTETDEHEKHHASLVFNTLERIESRHMLNDELTERLRQQTKDIMDPQEIPLPIELEEAQQQQQIEEEEEEENTED